MRVMGFEGNAAVLQYCLLYIHPAIHCGPSPRGYARNTRVGECTRLWMLDKPQDVWKMSAHPDVVLRTRVRVCITQVVR